MTINAAPESTPAMPMERSPYRGTDDVIAVVDRGSGLLVATIDRSQKRNALSKAVLAGLAATVGKLGAREGAKCIVVRGAGEKFFAAGGDLVELSSVRTDAEIDAMANDARAALDAIRDCPIPVVAYVNGDALGGGAELALACDLRIFAPHARLGFVQGRVGITSAWGGGPDLAALVGPARALSMMTRCEMVEAEQAMAWGLADAVVDGGLDGEGAAAFLRPILDRSALVLAGAKAQARSLRQGRTWDERRAVERHHLRVTWKSAEHWAAVDRFLSKEPR